MKNPTCFSGLILIAALACSTVLQAGENWSQKKIRPYYALSIEEGDKHFTGYFVADGDVCRLTMMIDDTAAESTKSAPARVIVDIASGRSATVDTVEGKSVAFRCEAGAKAMTATRIERMAALN